MLDFATLLVVIGLVLEYWGDIKEFFDHLRWPMAGFPWEKVAAMTGGILVTLGVAGEFICANRASHAESELRNTNHKIQTILTIEAADAKSSAEGAASAAIRANEAAAGALGMSTKAKAEASDALHVASTGRRQVGQLRADMNEAMESQQDLRRAMRQAFQATGNRTLDPFAFLAILKNKPTGKVELWVNIDAGEPHQFAWMIWHTLRRTRGWSAEIKNLQERPSSVRSAWKTGTVMRCRKLPIGDWISNPDTPCAAFASALLHSTDGTNVSSGLISEEDWNLGDNLIVIEVHPQGSPPSQMSGQRE